MAVVTEDHTREFPGELSPPGEKYQAGDVLCGVARARAAVVDAEGLTR
ncbi:hypothetical protein ACFVWX_01590 [Streptomyces sp. NPDC058220]